MEQQQREPLVSSQEGKENEVRNYKEEVEKAKKKLKNQLWVLVGFSFLISLGVFLAFFWVIE